MKSIFERITGTISLRGHNSDFEEEVIVEESPRETSFSGWDKAEQTEGELAVDVYQTNESIIVQAMVAGVSSDELSVSATREMVTIKKCSNGHCSRKLFLPRALLGCIFSHHSPSR
ncbi:MAG: Protein containing Heat shock protein Hsp20-like protein [Candidatus Azambacteria bacterium GW2011_GWA1_44_9]|uniref:Protein containing Heat shock protein Hsp20-like protein n=1 Tax=Candidatus Azambacteria bacterium GW2011_GWA1_44_9 TaxID=1618610 RepID=A0A0G1KCT4_9BACT|nr:MAG: Protein containing Heat shock protein Hsp20-like protein [Candidatus Azambacteria bacterium GW2011_GWA1_44_9]